MTHQSPRWTLPLMWAALTFALIALPPLAVPAAGQTQTPAFETATGPGPTPMRPYGQSGGCSEEPAEFHRCALAKAGTFNPPRTPDGTPDFQGFWSRIGIRNAENIEEHAESFDGSGGKSGIVDPANGRVPYQPWAAAKRRTNYSTYINPQTFCFPPGSPRIGFSPGVNQIIQTPASVIFLGDYAHVYRVVPTDGRPHVGPNVRLLMGDSRGHWEGNTLVIDVTNLDDRTWIDAIGNFYSDAVHVVERWTMFDPDVIHVEATIDDPKVYTRPWTVAFGVRRNTEPRYEMWENACVEGIAVDRGLRRRNEGRTPYPGVTVPK
jgi:hypothetical protein